MCDKEPRHLPFSARLAAGNADANAKARTGSRRRRLWELHTQCHCPVIGVCLPLASLRKLVGKLYSEREAEDYAVHVAAVTECAWRNTLSELLQDALDRRHALHVKRAKSARSREAVFAFWKQAMADGATAGAFWAALTHPQCDAQLEELLCRDMHMIQHQAGASERLDQRAYLALQQEHAVLMRELGKVQERVTQIMADKTRELAAAEARLLQARAQLIGRDATIGFLQADLAALHAANPTLEARSRLKEHITELGERLRERDSEHHALHGRLVAAQRRIEQLESENAQLQRALQAAPDAAPEAPALTDKTVFCVGGRNGNLAQYRGVVEQGGGRFAHHDGGIEESQEQLDAGLAAADLVICQTGCISHNAYWRVKEYCKRTGKQCVFVDNPSTSSFSRGLRQIAIRDVTALRERG